MWCAMLINKSRTQGAVGAERLHLYDADAVTAQMEKIIVDTDRLNTKCFLESFADSLFRLVLGSNIGLTLYYSCIANGRYQCLAVNFPVYIQRETLHLHVIRWNHIVRQLRGQIVANSLFGNIEG